MATDSSRVLKSKVLSVYSPEPATLEQALNEWLASNPGIEIHQTNHSPFLGRGGLIVYFTILYYEPQSDQPQTSRTAERVSLEDMETFG